jgi:Calx-beta domain
MRSWFSHLWLSSARQTGPRPRRVFLNLEQLEERRTPAIITVTSTGDTIAIDGLATLREAITSINNQADVNGDVTLNRVGGYASSPGGTPDVIDFNILGAGVKTISIGSSLPTIIKPLTINGYSQVGASANTLANSDNAVILIQLDGTGAGANVNGLTLGAGSGGSTIEGLTVNRFTGNGIVVQTGGNTIVGNFVGVDPTGTMRMPNGTFPNSGDGIRIENGSNNQIGGTAPADRNVVSGNAIDGIHIVGSLVAPATGNIVQGNFVGVAADGKSSVGNRTEPAPATGAAEGNNLFGIEVSGGNSNTIGGVVAGARNVVGLNGAGIEVDNGGQDNIIQGNFSGVGADGITPAGNLLQGIVLRSDNGFAAPLGPPQANEPGVFFNLIGGTAAGAGNLVEFNGTGGIAVFGNPVSASGQPNVGNAIEGNSIFENGRSNPTFLLGIDLTNAFTFPKDDGLTPNDSKGHGAPNDPNNFQNFPVLISAVSSGGQTTITGALTQSVSPNTTFRIEFFANDADPMGGAAEGQQFIGFTNVTTDANGNASFNITLNVPVANNRIVTATATDPIGNTSEFSAGLAAPTPQPTVQFSTASQNVNETDGAFTVTVTLSAASPANTTIPFTLGGTATAGTDFSGVTASPLVIPAGQTTGVITGTLIDDGAPDAVKSLTLTLGTPTNAALGATTADTLTIAETPAPPPPPPPPSQQSLPPFVSVAFGPAGEVLELVNSAGVLTQFDAAGAHQLGGAGVRSASVAFGPGGEVLEVVTTTGVLTQFDASGAHQLGGAGVESASIAFGPDGEVLDVVLVDGSARQFSAAGVQVAATSGVLSASLAFGPQGEVVEILNTAGVLTQSSAAGVEQLGGAGVRSAGVAFEGSSEVLDIIFADGTLDQFDAFGVHQLGIVH